MDARQLAQDILRLVGGEANVRDVSHCFTRLRFVLKNQEQAQVQAIEQLEGVIQVVQAGGQFQVVLGAKVGQVYEQLMPLVSLEVQDQEGTPHGSWLNQLLQTVSKMFTPIIPAIAASGLISGLLTMSRLIGNNFGVDISKNDTYVLLYAASQVVFFFMPIYLGYTAAKALKTNEFSAMIIGGFLCYPQLDALIQKVDTTTTIFGLPVIKGAWTVGESTRAFSYTGSVIPILLAVLVLVYLERFLKKSVPEILQIILVPGLSLIIMVPVTLTIVGPVGIWIGNVIQSTYTALMSFNAILGGAVVGGLWGVFVIFGAHRALLPIGLNDIAVSGQQNLLAFAGAANFSQGGAALGVMLKTKSQEMKSIAASATLSAAVVGITEPAIYGCNLRYKRPMLAAIICGALGGAIMGLGGVYGDAFANNGVLTIFTYAAGGMTKFVFYLVGCAVAYFGAAALTYFLGFEELVVEAAPKNQVALEGTYTLGAVTPGQSLALKDAGDAVFASASLGQGVVLKPSQGQVIAPDAGVLTFVYPTKHALGLTLDNGIELLIHIGVNTVELEGQHFTQLLPVGSRVSAGDALVEFDMAAIEAAGYNPNVMVIVANTSEYSTIEPQLHEHVVVGDPVLTVHV